MKILQNKGFSLIEILIVIMVLTLISLVVIPGLINFQREQSLKNTTENIIALLNKAKSDSFSSLNSNNYGVHFTSTSATYFIGNTFDINDPNNQEIDFEKGVVTLTSGGINLNGGGNDVIFPRLTGDTVGYGTIVIHLTSVPARQKIITINKIGSVSSD